MMDMRNLQDMADLFDRWMLPMDRPKYMIIGISRLNFSASAKLPSSVRSSPMERTFIFPDSIDHYIAGWLFNNSNLYRYTLLARNATFIPHETAIIKLRPLGGYIDGVTPFTECSPDQWLQADTLQEPYASEVFAPIDRFIEVAQLYNIPLAVVDIPMQYCNMRRYFPDRGAYEANYVQPIAAYLEQKDISFMALSIRFYDEVPEDEQWQYYMDYHHPNNRGAHLFSHWTGEFINAWLNENEK